MSVLFPCVCLWIFSVVPAVTLSSLCHVASLGVSHSDDISGAALVGISAFWDDAPLAQTHPTADPSFFFLQQSYSLFLDVFLSLSLCCVRMRPVCSIITTWNTWWAAGRGRYHFQLWWRFRMKIRGSGLQLTPKSQIYCAWQQIFTNKMFHNETVT